MWHENKKHSPLQISFQSTNLGISIPSLPYHWHTSKIIWPADDHNRCENACIECPVTNKYSTPQIYFSSLFSRVSEHFIIAGTLPLQTDQPTATARVTKTCSVPKVTNFHFFGVSLIHDSHVTAVLSSLHHHWHSSAKNWPTNNNNKRKMYEDGSQQTFSLSNIL